MSRSHAVPVALGLTCFGLLIAYVAAPAGFAAELLAAAVPAIAALVTIVSVVVARPARPTGWVVLAGGMALFAAARVAVADEWFHGAGMAFRDRGMPFPGAYQAAIVLAYPALAMGVLGLRPTQRRATSVFAGGGPAIYAVVGTALVWLGITEPYLADGALPLPEWAWVVLSPVLATLVAALVWLRLGVWEQFRGIRNLAALGVLGLAVTDLAHNLVWWNGDLYPGRPIAALWIVGPLAVAVLMGLPAIRAAMRTRSDDRPASWSQLVALLVASVGALGVLVFVAAMSLGSGSSRAVVCVAGAVVVLLAVIEANRLAREIRDYVDYRGAERLAAMVEHSSDIVVMSDALGRVNYVSPGITTMLGRDGAELIGRHTLDLVVPDQRAALAAEFARIVAAGHGTTYEFEADVMHADGQLRKATAVVANLLGSDAVDGIITTLRDVTEQRNLERQLSHRAFHDELTGLANRALFLDRMDHALRVTRSETDPVVVLFVDLDDFKAINDTHGHAAGDQVLQAVAARIRRAAGAGDTAARLGGDEFAVLLEDSGGLDRAITVAEGLLDELHDPIAAGGQEITVLASVGVAVATRGMSTSSLLRDADVAMYEAKRAGKGQIRLFDPAMRLVASKHLAYRGQLGTALDNDELRLVYMPYVDLRTGQVTGAEALVRWHHPEFGEISAAEFIPIAERSGLIVPMGYWIFDRGLAQAARWRSDSRLYVSFNVSSLQLKQPEFVDTLLDLTSRHGVPPSLVVLEITEAVLAEENGRVRDTIGNLTIHGFRFAVDDFGSGTASLSYVRRYPVDLIKIDTHQIARLGDDPEAVAMTRMILQLAESMKVLTVAEGIESTRQLTELRRWGCDLGQGYLLSHPLEADELERRFSATSAATPA